MELTHRKYFYRIVFIPETIGCIVYLSRHIDELKRKVLAGYHLTCIGGPAEFTFIEPRLAGTLSEKAMRDVLAHCSSPYKIENYTNRASDERQFCAPGVDLPISVLTKSKFGAYREYHTSRDNLDFVRPVYLEASLYLFQECLSAIEANDRYHVTQLGEPNLGKRGLYPTIGGQAYRMNSINHIKAVLAYSDGDHDLIDIANRNKRPIRHIAAAAQKLFDAELPKR